MAVLLGSMTIGTVTSLKGVPPLIVTGTLTIVSVVPSLTL